MRLSPTRRALLAFTLVASLPVPDIARTLPAQETADLPRRTPRSRILAIVGGLLGGAVSVGFVKGSGSGLGGSCLGVQCIILAGTAGGAAFGYLIGREYDITYAERYRGAPPLRIPNIAADLEGEPLALAIDDSTIAVAGSAGVQLFRSGTGLMTQALRAGGLRGISVVAIAPTTGWIALGSPSGLYLFPPGAGPGALVRSGGIGAATATHDRVFFGVDGRLEITRLGMDTTLSGEGIVLGGGGGARDLAVDSARSILWAITAGDLESYRISGDSLLRLGSAPLGGGGRRLAITHDTIAVAMGEGGIRLFDVSDPTAPRTIANWTVAHFVYDVSIDAGRLFAAAGPEGVYVIDLRSGTLRTLGLARDLGFASALASRGGHTYILDRRSNALRRIVSDF